MSIEELRRRFIVDEDVLKARLESLGEKALAHCVVDKRGVVHITAENLSAKEKIKLVLAARAIASELTEGISGEVSVSEISKITGLPENQVRARGNDLISEKYAESPSRGVFKALPHKIEPFLDSLAPTGKSQA